MSGEETYQRFLQWRDIEVPCKRCRGAGVRTYPSTSGARGGPGGCECVTDVCNRCWGSGDDNRHWPAHFGPNRPKEMTNEPLEA